MIIKRIFNKFIFLILFLFNFITNTFSRPKLFLANNDNNKTLNINYLKKIMPSDDYILGAGGSKFIKGPVTLFSYMSDGNIKKSKYRYRKNAKNGAKQNPYLKNNDLILVDTSFINSSAEVINEVSASFTGLLSVFVIIKAFE